MRVSCATLGPVRGPGVQVAQVLERPVLLGSKTGKELYGGLGWCFDKNKIRIRFLVEQKPNIRLSEPRPPVDTECISFRKA